MDERGGLTSQQVEKFNDPRGIDSEVAEPVDPEIVRMIAAVNRGVGYLLLLSQANT